MEFENSTYSALVEEIRQLVNQARHRVAYSINIEMLCTYWNIGKLIVSKEESKNHDEASVRQLLVNLSKDLTRELGKGFSRSQLTYMRLFYLRFKTFSKQSATGLTLSNQNEIPVNSVGLTVSNQLSWSHYHELLKCNTEEEIGFYHRILKCFVLIDLKVKSVRHGDIGQMNMYLNYFETEQNVEGDNPPIGIILSKHKDDITVEYATRGISNKIFVSKYQLYLPDKNMLQNKLRELLDDYEA